MFAYLRVTIMQSSIKTIMKVIFLSNLNHYEFTQKLTMCNFPMFHKISMNLQQYIFCNFKLHNIFKYCDLFF
jgi:hypothetical protein